MKLLLWDLVSLTIEKVKQNKTHKGILHAA